MAQNNYQVLRAVDKDGNSMTIAIVNKNDFGNPKLRTILAPIVQGKVDFDELNPNIECEKELIDDFADLMDNLTAGKNALWEQWEFTYIEAPNIDTKAPWTARDQGHVDEITKSLTTLAEEYNLNLDGENEWLKELKDRIK